MELDDRREILRQLLQSRVNLLTRQPRSDFLEYQIPVARNEFIVRLFESSDRHELPPAGGALLVLTQYSPQNAIEPRPYAALIAQVVQTKPGAAARLLHRILGVGAKIRSSRRERQETVEMRQHQRVETRVSLRE